MIYILIYILLGFFVGGYIWHFICVDQSEEEKYTDNPSIIVILPLFILFWPIALLAYIRGVIKNEL